MAFSRIKCSHCDKDFGQESRFLDHLADIHGVSDSLSLYLELFHDGKHPTCSCSESCPEKLSWSGWKKGFTSRFVRGHNARIDSVYLDPARQQEFAAQRVEGYRSGRIEIWCKGLSTKTDERLASAAAKKSQTMRDAYSNGRLVGWRTTDPEKALSADDKISRKKQQQHESGDLIIWNKGLTKDTDDRVAAMAQKISDSYVNNPDTGNWIGRNGLERRIVACHPKESKVQLELFEYVSSLMPDAILSDRRVIAPKELDVYVPSHRLGIEYDSLYFHSHECVPDDHAAKKLVACEQAGVSLLRIFEDEWRDRQDCVKAMVRHRLGIFSRRVGARKCSIRELDTLQRRQFIEANHLEGDVRSTASWGLFYCDELLAALSVRRAFHNVHGDMFEVSRFCLAPDVSVPGALSRLAQHALKFARDQGKRGLMTYVDGRIGSGKGYVAAGFKFVKSTSPRFWWTDFHNRFNRFQFKADKANGITQKQIAEQAGVVPIFGCGNQVFELT